ncbi:MAG: c-type cytochrome [Piscinibacter sp.]|uniref:c-type cytochrome n=1 Tax=Piscinibacter sp. TaxID=1903157 RepID=UPI00258E74D8|nr:c-type cytochrome [Piscinibacter sp.]MCW5666176.1 c-type cytochrome [Piscinibacter sp.]
MKRLAALLLAAAAALAHAADTHELGRRVYNARCYFCHGYSGDAKTVAAAMLNPAPRDFTAARGLDEARIVAALRSGRPGSAMASFEGLLSEAEMHAVAGFVRREFVLARRPNTAYHTPENGWPGHARHAAAFPFARGEIALDVPAETLSPAQQRGRRLFLTACISCHDRSRGTDPGPAWAARPVSYPRLGFVPGQASAPPVDAVSSASVYAKHEVAPRLAGLTRQQRRGEALFQANCAFCHAADGSGRNWIGQFMEPKARDLTQYSAATMPRARLVQTILDGLPGTSMPAWRAVLTRAEAEAVAAYAERAFFRH